MTEENETTMDEKTMDDIIEKLKNTMFNENETDVNKKLCNVDKTTCIDFFFEKLNELTDKQKLALNSLRYILKTRSFSIWGYLLINDNFDDVSRLSEQLEVKFLKDDVVYIKTIVNKINSSNQLITYKITNIIKFLKTLPIDVLEKLPIDVLKNLPIDVLKNLPIDVLENLPIDVLEKLPIDVLKTLPSNILIKLPTEVFDNLPIDVLKTLPIDVLKTLPIKVLEKLPIDVLKTLPSNILIKLPTAVFDTLSKNNILSKTKMKARTIGRFKTLFGYGGTKKKRVSKRRKKNKRSRRIRYT
jgi:hypothetical protein